MPKKSKDHMREKLEEIICKLKPLFFSGFICGPKESEKEFDQRVAFLNKEENLLFLIQSEKDLKNAEVLKLKVETLDISLNWFFFSEKKVKLGLFEAGATYEIQHCGQKIPFVEYKKNPFCDKEEVLLHEAIHAMRICYNENLFEEILAYCFSKSILRRLFGPFFHSVNEIYCFFISYLICLASQMYEYCFSYVCSIFLVIFMFFLLRAAFLHLVFNLALIKIKRLFPYINPKKIALFFTDKEFFFFAFFTVKRLQIFLKNQFSFRWKQVFSLVN